MLMYAPGSGRTKAISKVVAITFLSIATIGLLGACSSKKDSSSSDSKTVSFGTPDTSTTLTSTAPLIDETITEPVTVNWWHFWTDPSIKPTIDQIVAEFEKQNPNIKVQQTELTWSNGHEKIAIALAADSGPDLLELGSDWIPEFVAAGRIADVTANLKDSYSQFTGWAPVRHNGALYGMPWILGTRVMFYNRDLLTRAGFNSHYIPINLTQFMQTALRVDSLGDDIYGWGSNAAEKHRLYKKFLPFFWSFGATFYSLNNEYSIVSSMESGKALTYYKQLNDNYSMIDTQRRLEDAFLAGKIGAVLSGDWLLKRIRKEKSDLNFVTGLFPGQTSAGKSFLGGEYLVVNEDSENKGASLKFMKFLTSAENQVKFCRANFSTNPSNIEAAKDPFFTDDPNIMTFVKQLRLTKAPPFEPKWVYIEDEIEQAIERALFEDMGPFESLSIARAKIQAISRPASRN
jgi:multiple sugar transport system substrate-binding protein